MTMKSFADSNAARSLDARTPDARALDAEKVDAAMLDNGALDTQALRTVALRPVKQVTGGARPDNSADATEKLVAVAPVTEKLNPVVAAIPAQRRDSTAVPTPNHPARLARATRPRPRWEHLPTERHPAQAAPAPLPSPTPQAAPRAQPAPPPRSATPAAPQRLLVAKQPRWERSAIATMPRQGTLAAAGFAACDYVIRTVSILGLLAVVGMITAGTSQTHTEQAQEPGTTTAATAPAHPGVFTSTRHLR